MFNLNEFRAGQYRLSFAGSEDLPDCCFRCVYLCHEESSVCFCDSPFYYYCCYSWPDKLLHATPPCLEEKI